MKSNLYHLQFNISFKNVNFYKELMAFLDWRVIFEANEVIGFNSGQNGDLWFVASETQVHQDYDQVGFNHLAIRLERSEDVDSLAEYLRRHNVALLFDTPKYRPEFCEREDETYYQVMFETPDGLLWEVLYKG